MFFNVKKMLQIFVNGNFKHVKFSANMIKEISANLDQISKWIPSEFPRKTRSWSKLIGGKLLSYGYFYYI